jgi:hypothetical protein
VGIIVSILAIYGLAFFVKESDGPWGIMNWIRRQLLSNKYVGVFFFKLLDCYFCTGCWAGLAVYLLSAEHIKLTEAVVWVLAGGASSLILDAVLTRLHRQ